MLINAEYNTIFKAVFLVLSRVIMPSFRINTIFFISGYRSFFMRVFMPIISVLNISYRGTFLSSQLAVKTILDSVNYRTLRPYW